MIQLERDLENALLRASKEARDLFGYNATAFLEMLSTKGAKQTTEELILRPQITKGLTRLVEERRIDLSIEAIVIENEYKTLFDQQTIDKAKRTLTALEYDFKEYTSSQSASEPWSEVELAAAIDAYFSMLEKEGTGTSYSKIAVIQKLLEGDLKARRRGSIEYRMQNISYVLDDLGIKWIGGYKPAGNVGTGVSDQIKTIIFDKRYLDQELLQPTSSQDELERRTNQLRKTGILDSPKGTKKPRKTQSTSTSYERSPVVKAWVLNNANGICENCGKKGPFVSNDGELFLEVHHVKLLGNGGSDTIENAVALCPNCHRAFHFSRDGSALVNQLYDSIDRLIRE